MTKFREIRDGRGITYVAPLRGGGRPVGYEYASHVCYWYNRETRDWVVSLSDHDGNQVGNSEYMYSKVDAIEMAEDLASAARKVV